VQGHLLAEVDWQPKRIEQIYTENTTLRTCGPGNFTRRTVSRPSLPTPGSDSFKKCEFFPVRRVIRSGDLKLRFVYITAHASHKLRHRCCTFRGLRVTKRLLFVPSDRDVDVEPFLHLLTITRSLSRLRVLFRGFDSTQSKRNQPCYSTLTANRCAILVDEPPRAVMLMHQRCFLDLTSTDNSAPWFSNLERHAI